MFGLLTSPFPLRVNVFADRKRRPRALPGRQQTGRVRHRHARPGPTGTGAGGVNIGRPPKRRCRTADVAQDVGAAKLCGGVHAS